MGYRLKSAGRAHNHRCRDFARPGGRSGAPQIRWPWDTSRYVTVATSSAMHPTPRGVGNQSRVSGPASFLRRKRIHRGLRLAPAMSAGPVMKAAAPRMGIRPRPPWRDRFRHVALLLPQRPGHLCYNADRQPVCAAGPNPGRGTKQVCRKSHGWESPRRAERLSTPASRTSEIVHLHSSFGSTPHAARRVPLRVNGHLARTLRNERSPHSRQASRPGLG